MSVALSFAGTAAENTEYAQYVTLPDSQSYTITNDDYLTVTPRHFLTQLVTELEQAAMNKELAQQELAEDDE